MQATKKEIGYHVLGCLAFLILPILLRPHPPGIAILQMDKPVFRDLIANIMLIGFFYLNYYYLITVFYFNNKRFTYFAILLSLLILITFIPAMMVDNFFGQELPPDNFHPRFRRPQPDAGYFISSISYHIYLYISVMLFSLLLQTRKRWYASEKAKQAAELSYLKAQINPHFLFNTLNSIYALALKKDDATADAIVQLSDLMRFVIKDAQSEQVPLDKEIKYIHNYIALQKTRLRNTVDIQYTCNGTSGDKKIAPLLLITFIENAFQYGVNPDSDQSLIQINITISETAVSLKVYNQKVVAQTGKQSGKIGISNTKERLAFIYPQKHLLQIDETAKDYTVNLFIAL